MRIKGNNLLILVLLFGVISVSIYLFMLNRNTGAASIPLLSEVQMLADIEEDWKTEQSPSTPKVLGMSFVGENQFLALFINEETTEVAVVDKEMKQIWYTNPQDRNEDSIATVFEKDSLGSQFNFVFADSRRTSRTYYNNQDSIKKEQFEIEEIPNGIRIVYTVGDMSRGIESFPKLISEERFQTVILDQLNESDAKYVKRRWRLNEDTGVLERLDQGLSSKIELDRVLKAFDEAGYSDEDLNDDNIENDLPPAELNKPIFIIPMEYRIDGQNLIATIPVNEIDESNGMRIREIELLPFFGAASDEQEGYMLVPDGSGSLIDLNNGKTSVDRYAQHLYGRDQSKEERYKIQVSEIARLPVFGIKQGDKTLFGIVEHGDAISTITADISGKQNTYNYIFNRFTIRDFEEVEMVGMETVSRVAIDQPERYEGNITVQYSFLYGEDSTYSGMAHHYQQYLKSKYQLIPYTAAENIPFYLDVVGAINKVQYFLGVPYSGTEVVTTFEQAGMIINELMEQNIDQIHLKYQGWFNKGINHKNISKLKVDKKLGGKSDLEKLSSDLVDKGVSFYPDVNFLTVFQKSSGFVVSRDTARFINRKPARESAIFLPLRIDNKVYDPYYILSTLRLPAFVDPFLKNYSKLELEGISLRDLGGVVNSDHRVSRPLNRQQSAEIIQTELNKISSQIPSVMASSANMYSLPYIDHIIDVPLQCSEFIITDTCVPFYQMVIHGLVPYSGTAINLNNEQDYRMNLLKHLEYGANVQFTLGYASSSKVKETQFDYLYSINYNHWMEYASELYHELNDILKDVQEERMVSHQSLLKGVNEIRYENGKSIIINYNSHPVEINGMTIDAQNYILGRE
jgi:hypothetical protein